MNINVGNIPWRARRWTLALVFPAVAALFGAESVPVVTSTKVVELAPFKVVAEWMEIQPLLRNGKIESVQILNVRENSPAAIAGVRNGMRALSFQGIEVRGLTEAEFGRKMDAMTPANHLKLVVTGVIEPREIVIPLSRRVLRPVVEAGIESPSIPIVSQGVEPTKSKTDNTPRVTEDPSGEATRSLLAKIKRAVDDEMSRVRQTLLTESRKARAEGRPATVSISPNAALMEEARRLAAGAAMANLEVVCAMAVAAEKDDTANAMFSRILVNGINEPQVYFAAQKAVLLKYLPRLPNLIITLERMQWTDTSGPAIAEGWKKARRDERDGMLTSDSSRYAIIAARCGVADALVALASTVRKPEAEKRGRGTLLRNEMEALKSLVPSGGAERAAIGDYILKNKGKLVFDQTTKIYTLH